MKTAIVLSTLNARYNHASLGLRYLHANLGKHRHHAILHEATIKTPPDQVAREILARSPRLVGFGVYIWNTSQTLEVVRQLKQQAPELLIVLGGPEISFETESQILFSETDFVFKGEADFTFRDFVATWLEDGILPLSKVIEPRLPDLKSIVLPYSEYSDEDIRHRTLYVEASRGCPYKCEYCLSALDLSVRNFDSERFLNEMQRLIERGARQFKFVDRTFNLSPATSTRILQFFLEHIHLGLFLHFELVPDRLPDELKTLIEQYPPGSLQFEIGIQTWNPDVARNVSRRQNYERIVANLTYLREKTGVHTHADLIVGLPGESWTSFVAGFNALYELQPDEIQVGLLKRLKGTPIIRHDHKFAMKYCADVPFQILANKDLDADQVLALKIFADFWNAIANSGRFPGLHALVREQRRHDPFTFFNDLAQHLFCVFGRTHSIHLKELESEICDYLRTNGWDECHGTSPTLLRRGHGAIPARQARHLGIG